VPPVSADAQDSSHVEPNAVLLGLSSDAWRAPP
jgi:hypothetical protein